MSRNAVVQGFELTAAVVLWRGDELLVMKRASGFSTGGWFFPGGHVEEGERPAEACARELFEETGLAIDPAVLTLVDVMTYEGARGTAHSLIYSASAPADTEPSMNREHVAARWMRPEAYIARFLEADVLRAHGVGEAGIALAAEVARATRAAAAAHEWGA